MRIAYDGIPLVGERSGIGHYTNQLVRAVAQAGRDIRCVVMYPWTVNPFRPLPPLAFDEPSVEVPRPAWPRKLRRRLQEKLGVPPTLEALIGPTDVFHATNNVLTHRVRQARRVVTIHDLTLLLFPEWHPPARLREMLGGIRSSAATADRIIAVSEATKRDIVAHLGVAAERVTVVPLGVDPSFQPLGEGDVDAALAPLGLKHGTYLLFVGTLEPRKNVGRLLDAVLAAGRGTGPLVLAGSRGWSNNTLRERIAELTRQGRVRPLGYVPDSLRPPLLAGARAFVYPSLYEGFGLPPLEAMACGTPVMTSNVTSLPEVVGDAAVLIDPLDVDQIAGAIRRLWDDGDLRQDLGARGRARAREFSWARTARLTLDVYAAAMRA